MLLLFELDQVDGVDVEGVVRFAVAVGGVLGADVGRDGRTVAQAVGGVQEVEEHAPGSKIANFFLRHDFLKKNVIQRHPVCKFDNFKPIAKDKVEYRVTILGRCQLNGVKEPPSNSNLFFTPSSEFSHLGADYFGWPLQLFICLAD